MFRRSTLIALILLAVFIMAGFQVIWSVVLTLSQKTIANTWADHPGQLRVDPAGNIFIERMENGGVRYETTDGKPKSVPELSYWIDGTSLNAPLSDRERASRLSWFLRLSLVQTGTSPPIDWYLFHSPISEGEGYFIGYNSYNKRLVGYLSREGFRTTLPPRDQWFSIVGPARSQLVSSSTMWRKQSGSTAYATPANSQGVVDLVADGGVWFVDLNNRTIKRTYDGADAVSAAYSPIVSEAPLAEVPKTWSGGPYYRLSGESLLVRTPTEIIAMDADGDRRTSWPIPPKLRQVAFYWFELADGSALAAESRIHVAYYGMAYHWIDRDGNITREQEVSVTPRPPASREHWLMAAIVPQSCLMSLFLSVAVPIEAVEAGESPDYPTAVAQSLIDGWPALLTIYVLSAALAWLAYRRHARFALPGPGVWAVFVFLFGLPGWLAYRWHRRWPVLERCSQCQRAAPRDRDACAACGHIFVPSPPLGTEIFA